jgi:uncharacterized protein YdaU (DUF1376 family)
MSGSRPEYFSHDYYAENDLKLARLRMKHGAAGYGIYWLLVERLYRGSGNATADLDVLAFELREDRELIRAVMCDFDLFQISGDLFASESVTRRLEMREAAYKERANAGRLGGLAKSSNARAKPSKAVANSAKEKEKYKEKEERTDIAPPAAARELTPVQRIVGAYKIAKGNDRDDKAWDKANFGRYSKAAKSLLDCFAGNLEAAVTYLLGTGEDWDGKGITWTLETIQRHAWDNKTKLTEAANGSEHRPLDADDILGPTRLQRPTEARALAAEAMRGLASTGQTPDRLAGPGLPGQDADEI